MRVIVIMLVTVLIGSNVSAQSDTSYTLELHATIAPSFSVFEHERYPGALAETMFGYAFTLRAMWHPGRMLAVGLMSGYTRIASETLPSDSVSVFPFPTRATLTSVPLQAVVSMQGPNLEVGVGMGPHLVYSTLRDHNPAQGTRLELNLTLLASYRWILAPDISVASELRASYFSYRGVFSIQPSLTIRYDLFRY